MGMLAPPILMHAPSWFDARRVLRRLLAANALVLVASVVAAERQGLAANHYLEEFTPATYFSCVQIFLGAAICLGLFAIRQSDCRVDGPARSNRLWLIAAVGLAFLAMDEVFTFHENADLLLHQWTGLTPNAWSDRLDDLIVAGYGLGALLVLFRYRLELARYLTAAAYLRWGFALFFAMVAVDLSTNGAEPWVRMTQLPQQTLVSIGAWVEVAEECLKFASEAFFIAALLQIRHQAAADAIGD